jgi:hypothetical protein
MVHHAPQLSASPSRSAAATLRVASAPAVILVATALAILLAAALAGYAPATARDPELRQLLRFMAVIKGAMVAAALALLVWRTRWPLGTSLAAVYGLTCSVAAAAVTLIALGAWVGPAALAFHAAELSFVLAAWRDGRRFRPAA